MALGRFVFEGEAQHISEKLSEFLNLLAELAAESPDGIIGLEKVGNYYGWSNPTDVIISDAQWCAVDRSAISLRMEGSWQDMTDSVADLASFINRDFQYFIL